MRILIIWSGDLSHSVAIAIRDWLPVVLPLVETWVSSDDIPKGSPWGDQLTTELDSTQCGIICVTPDNLREPWLHFEAGALSKSVDIARAQVHPFLVGVAPGELSVGPLSLFQATTFTKDELLKLVRSINHAAGDAKLRPGQVDRNFDVAWASLERRLTPLADQASRATSSPTPGTRSTAPVPDPLDEQDITTLRLLAQARGESVFPNALAVQMNVHPERAKYFMEKLEAAGLLTARHNTQGTSWLLSRAGRAELVNRRLL
jgi:hypothetical protein